MDNEGIYTVEKMCRVLGVSRTGYYRWKERMKYPNLEKQMFKEELCGKITKSFYESLCTYGSPRVYRDLLDWGYEISLKTVARYMHEMSLRAIPTEKFVVTTDSNHDRPVYPNLVNRKFNISKPNRVWVADITYIWTLEGWLYLASVMDLYSRKIVGWALDSHMRKDLPLQALNNALNSRNVTKKLVHHSDRGSQYCSNDYVDILVDNKINISMSRKGDPYDNACIESFHATIKKELIYRTRFVSRADGRKAVANYIVSFYNERRRHSTIGYFSPNNYERKYRLLETQKIS